MPSFSFSRKPGGFSEFPPWFTVPRPKQKLGNWTCVNWESWARALSATNEDIWLPQSHAHSSQILCNLWKRLQSQGGNLLRHQLDEVAILELMHKTTIVVLKPVAQLKQFDVSQYTQFFFFSVNLVNSLSSQNCWRCSASTENWQQGQLGNRFSYHWHYNKSNFSKKRKNTKKLELTC